MSDEDQHLRDDPNLVHLLEHYAAPEDREAWQDRLMRVEGREPQQVVQLHGALLAYGWVEQNTGVVPRLEAGACPGCYRTTPAGRRALRRFRRAGDEDENGAAEAA